jgi:hypothetical protein
MPAGFTTRLRSRPLRFRLFTLENLADKVGSGLVRLRLKHQELAVRLGTRKLFQLSMVDNQRYMQERVSTLDTWSPCSYTLFGN